LRALVGWYQENATRDEITSTPTLIINGEKFSNMPYDELKTIIDEKLGA
jgi:protein-disulfide isomerase